ncbi:MAG: CBS domain-containing protein [Desulfobulbaceae bacterium]|nr:CBS domain-containing protein [Desulfobulbaceae bacterium]
MFVQNYMTPSPVTIQPDLLVTEALELLTKYTFRHLPVVDAEKQLLGMLTDRDLRSACPSSILNSEERQQVLDRVKGKLVSAIMSKDFISLRVVSTLDDALMLFETRSIGALPVVDDQKRVVGILSLNDMMAAYRNLFGLGEKGSFLLAIKDTGDPKALSSLVGVMEKNNIVFTRFIRTDGSDHEPAMIYLRINTYNMRSVHRAVEDAGFTVLIPGVND